MTKHNFFAGPAVLDRSVMDQAASAVGTFDDMGLSILEISHRSKQFVAVMEEAEALVRELLNLSDDYAVLFLTGGASSQFFMVPMNILASGDTAGYVDTGTWSTKAIKEAKLYGNIEVLASSKEDGFNHIPKPDVPDHLRYLHITSNNTIYGTQYKGFPNTSVPIVADMSSDIFNRPIDDISKFGVIYAGAQKNLGPAGTTLVIVRKDLLGKVDRQIPTMLNYETHIAKNSSFNTPPVFPIYVCMLSLRWLKANGGLKVMQAKNDAKAKVLYDEIDRNSLFAGVAATEDRSNMNVTFTINNADLEGKFLDFVTEHDIMGLKGHRSVGGFRASIYNALKTESVHHLVSLMKEFESMHA